MRPNGLLSEWVYYSKYCRPDLGCFSYEDSVRRLMKVLDTLGDGDVSVKGTIKTKPLQDNISTICVLARHHALFPSMRGIQFLDGILSRNERLFNCAGIIIDSWKKIHQVFYLLLCGCGVGFNISRKFVSKLHRIQRPQGIPVVHTVEDSVLGWAKALDALISSYVVSDSQPVIFDYSRITPAGVTLRSSGRPAPGPGPLINVLDMVRRKLDEIASSGGKARPIDVHDIICMASSGVVAGGVRRSALISLFDHDDEEMLNAKVGDWYKNHPYRSFANNSVIISAAHWVNRSKEDIYSLYRDTILPRCLEYGEPGVVHLPSHDYVVNPCCEIVFYPWVDGVSGYQTCNLTEVSVYNCRNLHFPISDAVHCAALIGTYQAYFTRFIDPVSEAITKRDALLGVSLTGLYDYYQDYDWKYLASLAVYTNENVAKYLGINPAARVTCIKPSGTVSCLAGHSSGVHPWFDTGLRNMYLHHSEAAFRVYEKLISSRRRDICSAHPFIEGMFVCPFPYTAMGTTMSKAGALDILGRVLYMTNTWIRHGYRKDSCWFHNSVSCTVHFRADEITSIAEFLSNVEYDYLHKHGMFPFVGLSFLAKSNSFNSKVAPFVSKDTDHDVEMTYYYLRELENMFSQEQVRNLFIEAYQTGGAIGEMNGGCDSEACSLQLTASG